MPRKSRIESASDRHAAPGGTAAVDRALSLLAAYRAGDDGLSLAEFAQRTQLYKSTVLRLLASLECAGLVQRRDDGRYGLGPELARLHSLYAATFSLEAVVMPVLHALVAVTGESAAYHVRQPRPGQTPDWARLCLYRVDSPQVLRDHVRPGDLLPADRGAGARVLIAFGPGPLPAGDRALYEEIRTQGYCARVGDRNPELAGISAPAFHADGSLAGAVTLTMPAHRYDAAAIPAVREAAAKLSGRV